MGSQNQDKPWDPEPLIADLVRNGSRTWTPQSIKSVDIVAIAAATTIMDTDKPELSQRIAPPGMPLEQFDRMLNVEITSRGMWPYVFEANTRMANGIDIASLSSLPEEMRPVMNAIRPKFSFPAGVSAENAQLRLDPAIVALYDSAVNTLVSNTSGFGYVADAAAAAGFVTRRDGKAYGYKADTDVADKRILYALGTIWDFNPANPKAQLTVTATTGQTLDQVQSTYCPLVSNLYQEGRSLAPRDAGLTGFIEGRIDSRNGYAAREGNFGITAPCPTPPAPRVANQR